jgi:hypothetical protein
LRAIGDCFEKSRLKAKPKRNAKKKRQKETLVNLLHGHHELNRDISLSTDS